MEDLQPYSMNGTIHPFLCEELGGFLGLHDAQHRFAVIADGVDGLEGTVDDLKLEEGVGKGFETGPILVAIQLAKGVLQLHAQNVIVDRNHIQVQLAKTQELVHLVVPEVLHRSLRFSRHKEEMEGVVVPFLPKSRHYLNDLIQRVLIGLTDKNDGSRFRNDGFSCELDEGNDLILLK